MIKSFKETRKIISIIVIITFILQGIPYLYSQSDYLKEEFNSAKNDYNEKKYTQAKVTLEKIIEIIIEQNLPQRDILWMSYLLLGAVYEKQGDKTNAKENYLKAVIDFGIREIPGVDLNQLPIYKEILKEIKQKRVKGVIENAIEEYRKKSYRKAQNHLIGVISGLSDTDSYERNLLGQAYLLLGAICEKEGEIEIARGYYRRAIYTYQVKRVKDIELKGLIVFKGTQKEFDIEENFEKAKNEFISGTYKTSIEKLKKIIQDLYSNNIDRRDLVGQCYLLLGAIYEKGGEVESAKKNYRKAIYEYRTKRIERVELIGLQIYERTLKELEIEENFEKAKNEFISGAYETSKKKIEKIIDDLKSNNIDRRDLFGRCYLLLGAIYDKEGKINLAKKNYLQAIDQYGIVSIEGVDLQESTTYKEALKEISHVEELEKAKNDYRAGREDRERYKMAEIRLKGLEKKLDVHIEEGKILLGKVYLMLGATHEQLFEKKISKEQKKLLKNYYQKAREIVPLKSREAPNKDKRVIEKEKKWYPIEGIDLSDLKYYRKYFCGEKKFPWLWVAGGIVVVSVIAILLLKKKKKKEYTLTVILGEGVDGSPKSGTYSYKEGYKVDYKYSINQTGYSDVLVWLDGEIVYNPGTVEMDKDHTLNPNAIPNVWDFVTNKDAVEIDEDGTADFEVWLTKSPPKNLVVNVDINNKNSNIRIQSGATFNFTPNDYNKHKTVELKADMDDNTTNGEAEILIKASRADGTEVVKTITVTEKDKGFVDNPPTVWITHPKGGDTVRENVTIEAEAQDDKHVKTVEFWVDNDKLISIPSPPFHCSCNWNTRGYINGSHTIKVVAIDSADQDKMATIKVNVQN
jgi:TPR repeat protein